MTPTTTRRVAAVAGVLTAVSIAAAIVIRYGPGTFATSDNSTEPATLTADATAGSGAAFPLLDEPRPVPELRFVDGGGRALTLADFRGRMVLLNIWATWCVPCRDEMPTLDRLQAELGGPAFEVLALSIDRQGIPEVKKFYDEIVLETLQIYVDASGKSARDLGVVGIPTTLLIDQNGNELGRLVGPAEWDAPQLITFFREQFAARDSTNP